MNAKDFNTSAALKQTTQNSSLSKRELHLIGLAVTLTKACEDCSRRRYTEALQSGISKKELLDLTDFIALTSAGVTIRKALNSWNEEDNAKICEDDICSVK